MRVKAANIAQAPFASIYETLRQASPAELRQWTKALAAIPQRSKRLAAISSFFNTLVQFDAVAAKELMLTLKGGDRWWAVMNTRLAAPPQAMRAMTEAVLSLDPAETSGHSYDFRAEAIQRWAESDPLAAKDFLDGRSGDQYMERVYQEFVRTWAAYDPEAARAWMETRIARTKAESDLESSYGGRRGGHGGGVAAGLFGARSRGRPGYLRTQTDPRVVAATRDIVGTLYAESPAQAREFILQLPAERREVALAGVVINVDGGVYGDADDRARSPAYLADWLMKFPPDEWKMAMTNVVREWERKTRRRFSPGCRGSRPRSSAEQSALLGPT